MPYKNKEDHRAYEKNTPKEVHMLRSAKHRAKKKGLEFDIDVTDIIIPALCPILGITIESNSNGKSHPVSSSPVLDRVDNSRGYVKGNVRVISSLANIRKSSLTPEQIYNLYLYSRGLI